MLLIRIALLTISDYLTVYTRGKVAELDLLLISITLIEKLPVIIYME